MTPKEKAIELFDKFIIIDDLSDADGNSLYFNAHAKQCALIAVDEMIEMLKALDRIGFIKQNSAISTIEEVKKEIEKL